MLSTLCGYCGRRFPFNRRQVAMHAINCPQIPTGRRSLWVKHKLALLPWRILSRWAFERTDSEAWSGYQTADRGRFSIVD